MDQDNLNLNTNTKNINIDSSSVSSSYFQSGAEAEVEISSGSEADSSSGSNSSSSLDLRAGASAIDSGSRSEAESGSSQSLPMVLVLKQDDRLAMEFSLDAQAVMEELGIKRSRLTQISGRELRVARIKMGQYIRPMYRPDDVSEYKNWSRATATHQKASSMVQHAADSLQNQAEKLSHTLTDSIEEFSSTLSESLSSIRSDLIQERLDRKENLDHFKEDILSTLNQSSNIHQEFLQNSSSSILDKLFQIEQKLLSLQDIKDCLGKVFENIAGKIESSDNLVEKLTSLIESQFETYKNNYERMFETIKSILQYQKEQVLKIDLLLKQNQSIKDKIKKKRNPRSTLCIKRKILNRKK